MPRILFIAAHRPGRSPSQRFRYEQYLEYLSQNGFEWDISYLISEKDDSKFYSPGNYFTKLRLFIRSTVKRLKDVINTNKYDIVFVQREAFMTGSSFFERALKKRGAKLVYDFDDAVWLYDVSEANKNLGWLKKPGKTAAIIKTADVVFAGNNYLAEYARNFNVNVEVVPTTIDTNYHKRISVREDNKRICIGWTGSPTTIKHFKIAVVFLRELKKKYGDRICFRVIGDESYYDKELEIKGAAWKMETEIKDLNEIDIGIMPLPEDEWSKGKCGFKGLQYMALEVPTVVSPIGVNNEIIEDGVNGFLARTDEEWVEKISQLIESEKLRKKIGTAARKTVEDKYSVKANRHLYLEAFRNLLEK